jgi:DNA-directed RNA polymerase specialized sigma24 family protein
MSSEKAKKDPGPTLEGDAKTVVDPPASDARLKTSISIEELRSFLARPATQAHIRKVVVARLNRKAPGALIEDLVQDANVDASAAQSRPRSIETATGWMGTVTARAIVNHFRREAADAKYLEPGVDVQELPAEPDESQGSVAPEWLLTEWLRPRVAEDPRDQETYELLVYKAETGKTHAQVAADHGMSEGTLKSRIRALKMKFEPQWRRRQRMFVLLILLGVAAAVTGLVWLLWPRESPSGSLPPQEAPILDRLLGNPLPVSQPRLDEPIAPDGGSD